MTFSKTTLLSIVGVSSLVAGGAIGLAVSTSAQSTSTSSTPNSSQNVLTNFQNKIQIKFAQKEAVTKALDASDYNAWKEAIKDSPQGTVMLQKVDTEEKFKQLVEAHNYEKKAEEIRTNLGLPTKDTMIKNHQALRDAIEKEDYNAFKEAIKGMPAEDQLSQKIDSEEKFKTLVEAHKALKNGDSEKAKTLFNQLGLQGPEMKVKRFGGKGMMGGFRDMM